MGARNKMESDAQAAWQARIANKVYVVLFLDGFGGIAALHTISSDYLGTQIDKWASEELARIREPFKELIARGGRSVAERFVVYGSDVEKIS